MYFRKFFLAFTSLNWLKSSVRNGILKYIPAKLFSLLSGKKKPFVPVAEKRFVLSNRILKIILSMV